MLAATEMHVKTLDWRPDDYEREFHQAYVSLTRAHVVRVKIFLDFIACTRLRILMWLAAKICCARSGSSVVRASLVTKQV